MEKEIFDKMLKKAIQSNDRDVVLGLARRVCKSNNPFYICDFAEMVELADDEEIMTMLEDAMIACDDIYHTYEFAFCMADSGKKHFHIKKFEELIRDSQNAKIMYYCLECLQGCDTDEMGKALMITGDTKYLKLYMENDDIPKHCAKSWIKERIDEEEEYRNEHGLRYIPAQLIESGTGSYGIDDNYLDNAITLSKRDGNPFAIGLCAEYLDCDIEKAFDAMMASDNILHIYEYYCSVPHITLSQRKRVLNYIANSGCAKYMYYVCEWTDLEEVWCIEMQKRIEETGNQKYIEKMEEMMERKFGHIV